MSLLVLLQSFGGGGPVPTSGVYNLPVSMTVQAIYPDGSAHSATRTSFVGHESQRISLVLGQV